MSIKYATFNYILNEISEREAPLSDINILRYINPDLQKAKRAFCRSIRYAMHEYEHSHPLIMNVLVKESPYEFKDNFDCYLKGILNANQITLIPDRIVNIKTGKFYLTANSWEYNNITHILEKGIGEVKYATSHPIVLDLNNLGKDDLFPEYFAVYYVDAADADFLNFMSYEVLNAIVRSRNSVQMPVGLTTFDFTNRLNELAEDIKKANIYSSQIYEAWG